MPYDYSPSHFNLRALGNGQNTYCDLLSHLSEAGDASCVPPGGRTQEGRACRPDF
jgi:hypothetical protein